MSILRSVYLLTVLVATFYFQSSTAIDYNGIGKANFRDLSCPNAEDIAPCICTHVIDEGVMDMDCDLIGGEQQLYDVFHTGEMIPIFRKLSLGTKYLTTLSDDVFGNATFVEVRGGGGSLTSVSPNTFRKSVSTLEYLVLDNNQITDFPFETIQEYSKLINLWLYGNPFTGNFPVIESDSLVQLILFDTFLHDIPAGVLDLPNLRVLHLAQTSTHTIAKGAFMGLDNLYEIHLENTGLTSLESLQLETDSPYLSVVLLMNNFIESVEPDTFKGLQSDSAQIILNNNKLTTLPEATWKPLLDAGVTVVLSDNDLTCGCDIAWLVLEPSYYPLVGGARCHTGEFIQNLDHYFYENNC